MLQVSPLSVVDVTRSAPTSSATGTARPYPGEGTSVADLIKLAEEYGKAALLLLGSRRKGEPVSLAPFRLCALQSIELHLNAFLQHSGVSPIWIRGLHHRLGDRSRKAQELGLVLRKLTADHLAQLDVTREYVVSRYAPDMVGNASEITRLKATLEQVAKAVRSRCLAPELTATAAPAS